MPSSGQFIRCTGRRQSSGKGSRMDPCCRANRGKFYRLLTRTSLARVRWFHHQARNSPNHLRIGPSESTADTVDAENRVEGIDGKEITDLRFCARKCTNSNWRQALLDSCLSMVVVAVIASRTKQAGVQRWPQSTSIGHQLKRGARSDLACLAPTGSWFQGTKRRIIRGAIRPTRKISGRNRRKKAIRNGGG